MPVRDVAALENGRGIVEEAKVVSKAELVDTNEFFAVNAMVSVIKVDVVIVPVGV